MTGEEFAIGIVGGMALGTYFGILVGPIAWRWWARRVAKNPSKYPSWTVEKADRPVLIIRQKPLEIYVRDNKP